MKIIYLTAWIGIATAGMFSLRAYGQETSQRFVQERLTENLEFRQKQRYFEEAFPVKKAVTAKAQKLLLSYGGWVDVSYTDFHDDDNSDTEKDIFDADLSVDTRVWAKAVLRTDLEDDYLPEFSIYTRFSNFYISRWPNEEQPLVEDDNDGPHTDLLYLNLEFPDSELRIGRQYLALGQGITYSNVHDGLRLIGRIVDFELTSFAVKTLPHEENIDYSVPGFDKKSERYFVGNQLTWRPVDWGSIYGYMLAQHDESDPRPENGQDYDYHSQYWSIGATVSQLRHWSAWGEYILETGSSAVFGTSERSDILAHAFDFGTRYQFECLTQPDLSLEYAFGSGDKDRTSVTNTEGGNTTGKDYNFLSFGYFPAGYALAPTLSNIHILRAGTSLSPFDKFWQFQKLRFNIDGYFYWKDAPKGGIFDIDATAQSREIGSEIDFTLDWPILSDLIASVRYGIFIPGSAFPRQANSTETHLSTSLTFSF